MTNGKTAEKKVAAWLTAAWNSRKMGSGHCNVHFSNTALPQWLNIIYGLNRVRNRDSIKSEDKISNVQSSLYLCPAWGNCLVSIRENCSCSPSLGKITVAFNQANILLNLYSFCHFNSVIEDAYNKDLT